MKIHARKKARQQAMKKMAQSGLINRADGVMVPRGQITDNSMRRDYCPQNKV